MPNAFPIKWLLGLLGLLVTTQARAKDSPTFERDIKPMFARRCTVCHSRKNLGDLDISAGLALDSFEATVKGTSEHRVIEPGRPDKSELFRRLNDTDEDTRMPLSDRPLSEPQRDLIRRWIAAGAPQGILVQEAQRAKADARPARRSNRSLDVVIPLDLKLPSNAADPGSGGPIRIALKVGPLPAVSALVFRGDGHELAVGTSAGVILWNLVEGQPVRVLSDVPGAVHGLAYNRDGKRLAVGAGWPARSGSVRVYAVPGGTLIHDFEGHDDVVSGVAFRPDGGQLASASYDQAVRLWDLEHARPAGVFRGHSDSVSDVAYTRDGRFLLSTGIDTTIKRLGLKPLKELRTYSGHDQEVLAVAVRPDGTAFVTSGGEPQLRWWTLDSEKPTSTVGGHSQPVFQLAFSGDGRRLISASADQSLRVWDGRSGTFERRLAGPTDWQYAAALSHDGHLAAAGGWDGLVRLWDADSGRLIATFLQLPPQSPAAEPPWLIAVPQGYVSGSADLLGIARVQVGATNLPHDGLASALQKSDAVTRALRGEVVESGSHK